MFALAVLTHFSAEKAGGKQNSSLPGPPESFGMGKVRETAPKGALGCITNAAQDAKTEILGEYCCVHPDRRFSWNSESGYSSPVSH